MTEHGDLRTKTEALKKVIQMMLNGEKMQSLLMTVIRFVMPLQDHTIKKMLLIFWEVVPKYTADGKMLHEMILVCDAYRKVCNNTYTVLLYCIVYVFVLYINFLTEFFLFLVIIYFVFAIFNSSVYLLKHLFM